MCLHEPQAMNVMLNIVFKYQQRMIFSIYTVEIIIITVQYSAVQYSTVQYSNSTVTVYYSTVQYSTVQYITVQYSTVHNLMHVQAQVLY